MKPLRFAHAMYLCAHVGYKEVTIYLGSLSLTTCRRVYCEVKGEVKVKVTLEQAAKAQRGSSDIALLFP